MNRDQIINHFTENIRDYQRYSKNIAGMQDADDLFQECSLMLLEFDEDRLKSYWNEAQGLKPFFLRMLQLQYKSKTSKFHKEYRKQEQFIQSKGADIVYNDQATELEPFEVDMSEMIKGRNSVHILNGQLFPSELEDMVFNLYTERGSLRKALEAIPEQYKHLFDLKTVHGIVKKFRRTIKAYLKVTA